MASVPDSTRKRERDEAAPPRHRCLTPPLEQDGPGEALARRLQQEDPLFNTGYIVDQVSEYQRIIRKARGWLDRYRSRNEGDHNGACDRDPGASGASECRPDTIAGPCGGDNNESSNSSAPATGASSSSSAPLSLMPTEQDHLAQLLQRRIPPTTQAFNERYRRLVKIGEGTYGDVFIIYDTHTNNHLAMKRMRNLFHDPGHSQLVAGVHTTIVQELKMLQVLSHDNILKMVDFHFMEDGVCVLLLPLVTHDLGGVVRWWKRCYHTFLRSRTDAMSRAEKKSDDHLTSLRVVEDVATLSREGRLPLSHVKCILHQLLEAVSYMHQKGVWHRDIKMSNLMINHDGRLVVVDFGWSRFEPYTRVLQRRLEVAQSKQRHGEQPSSGTKPPSAAAHTSAGGTAGLGGTAVSRTDSSGEPSASLHDAVEVKETNEPCSESLTALRSQSQRSIPPRPRDPLGPALTGPVGTVNYRPPEVLIGSPSSRYYDGAVDLWSVGCVAYELIVGEPLVPGRVTEAEALKRLLIVLGPPDPYSKHMWPQSACIGGSGEALLQISEAQQRLIKSDAAAKRSRTSRSVSDAIKKSFESVVTEGVVDEKCSAAHFVSHLLQWDPRHRMSARHALEHPWLKTTEPTMCQPSGLLLPQSNTYSYLMRR